MSWWRLGGALDLGEYVPEASASWRHPDARPGDMAGWDAPAYVELRNGLRAASKLGGSIRVTAESTAWATFASTPEGAHGRALAARAATPSAHPTPTTRTTK